MVIGIQWLVLVPPCQYEASDHILSLSYIIFLLIFISCLSAKTFHIKDNRKESHYISLLILMTVPTWIIWMVGASLLPQALHNACFGKLPPSLS